MSTQEQPNRPKSTLVQGIVVLTSICLCSGAGVGLLYSGMKGEIAAKERETFFDVLAQVLPEGASPEPLGEYGADVRDEDKVYVAADGAGVIYVAKGQQQGYSSVVKVLASVRAAASGAPVAADPVIEAMAVVSSAETPGLGENIKAIERSVSFWAKLAGADEDPAGLVPKFQEQFRTKKLTLSELTVVKQKDPERVEAITGATVTSEAAAKAVRNAVQAIIDRTSGTYIE